MKKTGNPLFKRVSGRKIFMENNRKWNLMSVYIEKSSKMPCFSGLDGVF